MFVITKSELSDRNWKLQQTHGYPNIPKGTKVWTCGGVPPADVKYTQVWWGCYMYTVRVSDLEFNNEQRGDSCE